MTSDIEIAQSIKPNSITQIGKKIGLKTENLKTYGQYIAKVSPPPEKKAFGKLVLVSGMSPTAAGEGKTTVAIGLDDALNQLEKKSLVALREPSMGPVFGLKGGATGGGRSQLIPMEDINLSFTGDIPAIGYANNLLAALVDSSIKHKNPLDFDLKRIALKRVLDINDRQLRQVIDGLGGHANGSLRPDGFSITAACEIMAIICLAKNPGDLKRRLGQIVVGYSKKNQPITAGDLQAQGALAVVLKDAIRPNLVQTLAGNGALVHGGPFANIAHGASSLIASRLALGLADYTITEAGFGADLGAEKFLSIVSPRLKKLPECVVLVASLRALKENGGAKDYTKENRQALASGFKNLNRHLKNLKDVYGLNVVVALNRFRGDSTYELNLVSGWCKKQNTDVQICDPWGKGGDGCLKLARQVISVCQKPFNFTPVYHRGQTLVKKITAVAQKIYHAKKVAFTPRATRQAKRIEKLGFSKLPVCIAKTQYSFSADKNLRGAPKDFTLPVKSLSIKAGAGFVVAYTGSILTMPGLPKDPAAAHMDIDDSGKVSGLF